MRSSMSCWPHVRIRSSGTPPSAAGLTFCSWSRTSVVTSRRRPSWWSATRRGRGPSCTAWSASACRRSGRSGTPDAQLSVSCGDDRSREDLDDVPGRLSGVEPVDVMYPAIEHRALVDIAFVGYVAGVERRRVGEEQHPGDAGRRSARVCVVRAEPVLHRLHDDSTAGDSGGILDVYGCRQDAERGGDVYPREQSEVIAVETRYDRVS